MNKSIKLPDWYYDLELVRDPDVLGEKITTWFNNLSFDGRGSVNYGLFRQIVKYTLIKSKNYVKKYIAERMKTSHYFDSQLEKENIEWY